MQDIDSVAFQAELWSVAEELAEAARAAILPHFRQVGLSADNKERDGFDPVTIADKAAEEAMRAVLHTRRPQDAILGEEFGNTAGTSGLTWVLDPIDGTRGFISGTPTWGVLISLNDESGPRLGIIDQPYIGERFCGGFGRRDDWSAWQC
jgi:fructose-1,6-bisphosphatase/inositol monophosphatase family enzyme